MHNLKPRTLPANRRREMAFIPRLPFKRQILERHIRALEHPDRQRVFLVLPDRLQDPREQTRPHDLVLRRLGVRQTNRSLSVVLPVQPSEILIVRAEDEWHNLRPPAHGCFCPRDVAELVDRQRRCDGAGFSGEGFGEVVVPVSNGHVLHNIALVEDVGAVDGDLDVNVVGVCGGGSAHEGHLLQHGADLGGGEGETAAGVDVRDFGDGWAGGHVGHHTGFGVVLGHDGDGFHGEGFVAVLGEHGDKHVDHDLDFGFVGGGHFDKDVAGFERDFGVVAVDDGGERADGAVGVEDNGIHGGVPDDVKEAAEVFVVLRGLESSDWKGSRGGTS